MRVNIIEFVEARLDEAARSAVAGEPLGYDQVCRIVDVLRAMAMQVAAYLDGSPTDQPVAAGLLPMAMHRLPPLACSMPAPAALWCRR